MPGKLAAARAWAARGFRVFPLRENSRMALPFNDAELPCVVWTSQATTDPAQIERWWLREDGTERENNIGFLTSGHIVPDVDVKDGKPGLETMIALGLEFDTLTMRTTSGGYHLVYQGLDRPVGQAPLGDGVDLRSHNGYVVAPGSTIDGRAYAVELDLPVRPFPEHLRERLKSPRQRGEVRTSSVALDAPEAVEIATHWLLREAPPAVEGANGNDTSYRVACRLRDLGLSEQTALELFQDEYNPRCEPPWSAEDCRRTVENAYRYATGDPGAASPAVVFGDVQPVAAEPGTSVLARQEQVLEQVNALIRYGNMVEETSIRPRAWVVEGLLMSGVVTLLNAPGGVGKSLISLIIAAHLAVGKSLFGFEVRQPGKSIIYNAEDDLEEQSRRLIAICDAYGFDRQEVASRICLLSSEHIELQVTQGSQPPQMRQDHVAILVNAASDPDVVMLAVDPLVEIHSGHENDTGDMRYVMGVLRMVARLGGISVLAIHHTGKPPNGRENTHAGDQYAGRGSSALPAAARIVLTMFPATEADTVEIGVPRDQHASYVRLDGAKANTMSAQERKRPRWMRWHGRQLVNGDKVGVLLEHDCAESFGRAAAVVGEQLRDRMLRDGTASLVIDAAVKAVQDADPVQAKDDPAVVKSRLLRLLAEPVDLADKTRVARTIDVEGGRKVARVVLTSAD